MKALSSNKKKTSGGIRKSSYRFSPALFGQRGDAYIRFAFAFLAERHRAVYQCEQRVVLAHADVLARVVHRAALTDDDVASLCELTAEQFDAEPFAFRLAAVLGTTYTFLVCHVDSVF